MNATLASTYLYVTRARWGNLVHRIFYCFALATSTLVSAMLMVGSSAVVNKLTVMSIHTVIRITPFSVAICTSKGGMQADIIAD
ncbi:hypothetical protein CF319_g7909 [Tilletia indica]|uniref:Uncharacterized protein n=1 Tax=Tilletia indica TaxID=43049 RepID=A0A8T8SGI2_9BASI|nr:hypothetical protein CF319_g7909 [Tilletia indica]KAE8240005.1 hypothetical protein A4X13_0g7982 [Tilletia indica]